MSKIKVGVFGCGRGSSMVEVMSQHPDAELTAICDKYEEGLNNCDKIAKEHNVSLKLYKDFDEFISCGLDAVVLANYATEHAPYAIKCLENNIHVSSENVAVTSMEEAFSLLNACKKSKAIYSYAENCCFTPFAREAKRIYDLGDLGQIMHAEADYIHYADPEERAALTNNNDPNHWRNNIHSTFYCTHSMGPILYITGLRPVEVMGIEGPLRKDFFENETAEMKTGAMIIVRLNNGAIAKLSPGCHYPRIPVNWYVLYGSKGCVESDRFDFNYEKIHVNLQKDNNVVSYKPKADTNELAKKIHTHGGADFYTMNYFLDKILGRETGKRDIDIYQALDMTCVGILAQESIKKKGQAVQFPDFRNI